MNRRNFLKFAPALVAVPVVAIAAASNKVAPPNVASLPLTLEGENGTQLVFEQIGNSVGVRHGGAPKNTHAFRIVDPTLSTSRGIVFNPYG